MPHMKRPRKKSLKRKEDGNIAVDDETTNGGNFENKLSQLLNEYKNKQPVRDDKAPKDYNMHQPLFNNNPPSNGSSVIFQLAQSGLQANLFKSDSRRTFLDDKFNFDFDNATVDYEPDDEDRNDVDSIVPESFTLQLEQDDLSETTELVDLKRSWSLCQDVVTINLPTLKLNDFAEHAHPRDILRNNSNALNYVLRNSISLSDLSSNGSFSPPPLERNIVPQNMVPSDKVHATLFNESSNDSSNVFKRSSLDLPPTTFKRSITPHNTIPSDKEDANLFNNYRPSNDSSEVFKRPRLKPPPSTFKRNIASHNRVPSNQEDATLFNDCRLLNESSEVSQRLAFSPPPSISKNTSSNSSDKEDVVLINESSSDGSEIFQKPTFSRPLTLKRNIVSCNMVPTYTEDATLLNGSKIAEDAARASFLYSDKNYSVAEWLNDQSSVMDVPEPSDEDRCKELAVALIKKSETLKNSTPYGLIEFREFTLLVGSLSPTAAIDMYRYVCDLDTPSLYNWTFDLFVDRFTLFGDPVSRDVLRGAVGDVFQIFRHSLCDKTVYIDKIVKSLTLTSTFQEVIESIFCRYGTENITLCDILLFIIVKNNNLEEDYCLVEKTIENRESREGDLIMLDQSVVERMLKNCVESGNDELQAKISKLLVKKRLVEIEKFPPDLLIHNGSDSSSIEYESCFDQMLTANESRSLSHSVNQRFRLNVSLHELYPDVYEETGQVMASDLSKLENTIIDCDGEQYVRFVKTYEHPVKLENFLMHSFLFLQRQQWKLGEKLMQLHSSIKEYISDGRNKGLKVAFEVLVMNSLVTLEQKNLMNGCRVILHNFKHFDWKSLITSKVWVKPFPDQSHMGRYAFLFKLFVKVDLFHWAYELLWLNDMTLLESPAKWPFDHIPVDDEKRRNEAVQLFLTTGRNHLHVLNDFYKYVARFLCNISEMDVWRFFNEMIKEFLDEDDTRKLVKLLPDVLEHYLDYTRTEILRAYFIKVATAMPNLAYLKDLFSVCLMRNAYGDQASTTLTLFTNMYDVEILYIMDYFFGKLRSTNVRRSDFYIKVKVPDDDQPDVPKVIRNGDRSVIAINRIVKTLLRKKYFINVASGGIDTTMHISADMQAF